MQRSGTNVESWYLNTNSLIFEQKALLHHQREASFSSLRCACHPRRLLGVVASCFFSLWEEDTNAAALLATKVAVRKGRVLALPNAVRRLRAEIDLMPTKLTGIDTRLVSYGFDRRRQRMGRSESGTVRKSMLKWRKK